MYLVRHHAVAVALAIFWGGAGSALAINNVEYWNAVAVQAIRDDFSGGAGRPENPGPTFTSRAMAIVHGSMYDAYAYVTQDKTYYPATSTYSALSYQVDTAVGGGGGTSPLRLQVAGYAIGEAAFTTLSGLYPSQNATFVAQRLAFYNGTIPTSTLVSLGRQLGAAIGRNWLSQRAADGSQLSRAADASYVPPNNGTFAHRPDPLNPGQGYLGTVWGNITPFGYTNTTYMRAKIPSLPSPLASSTSTYVADFNEVAVKGINATNNTAGNYAVGLFWAYDGANKIGVPLALYNQITLAIARQFYASNSPGLTDGVTARLFAVVNLAMADAGIQAWYEKYRWNFWRPILGVRSGSALPATTAIPGWIPMGSPRSNTLSPSFTPGFPAYPSGHATFGTALFNAIMGELNLKPSYNFTYTSDELNGITFDSYGTRPKLTRTLSLQQGITENLESRVWLGVHWRADGVQGARAGEYIGVQAVRFPQKVGDPDH